MQIIYKQGKDTKKVLFVKTNVFTYISSIMSRNTMKVRGGGLFPLYDCFR